MSNNQLTPHIETIEELTRQERWQNHEIFNMDQTDLSVELLPNKVILKKGHVNKRKGDFNISSIKGFEEL